MARETGRTRAIPVVHKPALSGEAAEAAKIDAAAAAKAEKAKNEPGENGFNPDWLRLALATGGGLIGHSLASSLFDGKTEEEKRRESLWTKLLSAMLPIGAAGLGAWGGYALGGQLKNAADNQVPQNGNGTHDGPMGTEMEIDGRLYGVSPELVPTVHSLGKGWYPGMKSTEMQFMQEKGPRDIDKEKWNEMVGNRASLGFAGLGGISAGYGAFQGGKKGIEYLLERSANKVLTDASRVGELTGDLKVQIERARKAEELLNSGKKGINRSAVTATKAEADALSAMMRQEISKLQKGVRAVDIQKAKAVAENAGKSRSGMKSLLGLGSAAAADQGCAGAARRTDQQCAIRCLCTVEIIRRQCNVDDKGNVLFRHKQHRRRRRRDSQVCFRAREAGRYHIPHGIRCP